MYKYIRLQHYKKAFQKGVTLIEMLVVMGIFVAVSSVLLFNYSDFSTGTSLRNTTQDIGLTIRKAQTYATSVQSTTDSIGGTFYAEAYGIHFGLPLQQINMFNNLSVGSNRSFLIYKDITNINSVFTPNKKLDYIGVPCGAIFNGASTGECVQKLNIIGSDRVTSFCGVATAGETCFTDGFLDITFRRPSPDALFCLRSPFSLEEGIFPVPTCDRGENFSHVKITIASAKGVTRTITVWNTGQISIN